MFPFDVVTMTGWVQLGIQQKWLSCLIIIGTNPCNKQSYNHIVIVYNAVDSLWVVFG